MDFFRSICLFTRYILFFLLVIPTVTLADNAILLTNNPYSIGLDLGVAKPTNLGSSASFPLGYSTFTYSSGHNNVHALFSGVSLGKVFTITPLHTLQVGLSYHNISRMDVTGTIEQGISQPYYQSIYYYDVSSSLYLAEAKLSRQFCNHLFPYLYVGLGMASNSAYHYTTDIPGYLTMTPNYRNHTWDTFSYSLGIGLDYFPVSQLSIGLGYRFINLGNVGLGTGVIRNTQVNAELTQSNLIMNTLVAQLNYFI